MKKILCILFCLLPVLGGKAQTLYRDQVRIEKESITRNEDNNVLSYRYGYRDAGKSETLLQSM